jgi:hypothetical protein
MDEPLGLDIISNGPLYPYNYVQPSITILLVFKKNKKVSSLTGAIICIISLSFLPLNDGNNSALLLFSAEPVFAQLSEQSIPYGEEQVLSPPFSSASTMDFGRIMDSFANSIFNGTSTFAGVGTSIVDGLEVSGIILDKSQNQLSVTVSGTAAKQAERVSNNTAGSNRSIITSATPNSNSVSVIAMRIPISTLDILSIGAATSSSSNIPGIDGVIRENSTENRALSSDIFNPFSLLSGLQIGSSTLIDVDWSQPQTVTMDLIGNNGTNQQQHVNSGNETAAEFVLVSVIPYTGIGNETVSSRP